MGERERERERENIPEDGGDVAEVGETAENLWPGVRDDRLEVGLGQHARVVESLHRLDDLVLLVGTGHLDDDGVPHVDDGVEEVEDMQELFGAGREVPGGEGTGVVVLPEEVQQPPGELLLDLLVLETPGVLHGFAADQTAPATGSLQLAHPAVGRHADCQTGPAERWKCFIFSKTLHGMPVLQ